MSRTKKILLYGGAVVGLLLIGLVILVHLLITPERVKGWALPLMEENLQRDVQLADVKIGLFSGIALHDLTILDRDGKNTLLEIQDLVLSYRFWPLLSGRLVVDDVQVIGPKIRLVQNADGTMNIDDLLEGSEPAGTATSPSAESTEKGKEIDLLVSRVLLEGGDVLLVNKADEAATIHLQDIHVLVKNISLEDSFPVEVSALLNDTEFRLEGDFQPSASQGRFDLLVQRLDLNKFIPADKTDQEAKRPTGKSGSPTVEPGPIEIPITLAGKVQIDELLYQDMVVKDVHAEYQLKDNHFNLQQLVGQIFDGQFKLQSDVDLGKKGFAYLGDFSLEGVDLQSLIPALIPKAEKSSHGLLGMQLDFSGSGLNPDRMLKQLKSKGSFQLADGKLMGNPLLTEFAKFLGNPELKVLSFQSITGEYDLSQGLAQVKAALDSSKTRLDTSGSVHVDGPLDLQLETRLAPEMLKGLSTDSPFRKALTDADGWGVIPLKIGGTYTDPKFRLSGKGMRSQAEDQVKQKLGEKLQEKLGDEAEPAKKLIDDSLKKLFGK